MPPSPAETNINDTTIEQTLGRREIPENLDEILARDLKALSFKDRKKIQEEIHGVGSVCPEETPEMVAQSLQLMRGHLDAIPTKTIYDQVSPNSYIHSEEFWLRFLRCELFDCKKAAERFVRFTEYMNDKYGMVVLERPLRLHDLSNKKFGPPVMKDFKIGSVQLLPFRDRNGRRILAFHGLSMGIPNARKVSTH